MKQLLIYIILISSVIIDVKAHPNNAGVVPERQDTIMLNEVVVTAAQELTRIDGDGMLTTVQGTVLQNLGSAKDVLGYIPGVINNNGSIEVFGKGTPVLYINGRPMRNPLELDQLKSYQVKDVKVISNPGARYGSGTNAVIRITTVKNPGDGFALDTKTVGGYRDYLYANEQVNMNYRTGGLDIFSILHYDYSKSKGTNTNVQNTWTKKPMSSVLDMTSKIRQQIYDDQIGFNYTTPSGHSFGAYYQGMGRPSRDNKYSVSTFSIDNTENNHSELYTTQSNDYYQHLVDGYYSGTWGKWSADITFDYLWRSAKDSQNVVEHTLDDNHKDYGFFDESKGRMFAGEFNLSRTFWRGSLNIGASYSNTQRDDDFISPEGLIEDNSNKIKEDNLGIYAETSQRIGNMMLQLGLRYEHIDNRYFVNGVKLGEQSKSYNEILPSATLVIPFKKTMFQLGYSRKYSRPFYAQLSSSVLYVNEYLYETGNPALKSSYSDVVSLNIKYKWLMVMASYKHQKDRVISVAEEYNGNPDITLLKKINSPEGIDNLELMVSIAPGFISRFYYPVLMGGMTSQFYDIEYRGSTMKMNRPMGIVRFNNIFKLPNNYMISANLSWRGKGDSENIRMGQSWQVDLAASKTFNSHWDVKLSLNDIFNTARTTNFTLYSGPRDMSIDKRMCKRSVEITVGYRFNVSKSKYKGKGAGADEKERL